MTIKNEKWNLSLIANSATNEIIFGVLTYLGNNTGWDFNRADIYKYITNYFSDYKGFVYVYDDRTDENLVENIWNYVYFGLDDHKVRTFLVSEKLNIFHSKIHICKYLSDKKEFIRLNINDSSWRFFL